MAKRFQRLVVQVLMEFRGKNEFKKSLKMAIAPN